MRMTLDPDSMHSWLGHFFARDAEQRDVIAGVNDDDCAVVRSKSGYIVMTTDFLNSRPIAVELGIADPLTLGRLVVAANIADLCGSGATPAWMLVGVMLPRDADPRELRDIMRGAREEGRRCGVRILGGDTKLGSSRVLYGTAIGIARTKRQLFLKGAAKPGDDIFVSGHLGGVTAAVLALNSKNTSVAHAKARAALCQPSVPVAKSAKLARLGVANAGIDLSDGLGEAMQRLLDASEVGAEIEASYIPVASFARIVAHEMGVPPWTFAFALGGDFQFIVTAPARHRERIRKLGFQHIGTVTKRKHRLLRLPDDRRLPLPNLGHRDARAANFTDEAIYLVKEATRVAE